MGSLPYCLTLHPETPLYVDLVHLQVEVDINNKMTSLRQTLCRKQKLHSVCPAMLDAPLKQLNVNTMMNVRHNVISYYCRSIHDKQRRVT